MPLGAHRTALMGVAGVATGDVVLLDTQTAANSTSISFTSKIDSTYGEYIFRFYRINPVTDNVEFRFQVSTDGGSSYGITKTSTYWRSYADDAGSSGAATGYEAGRDLAQSTSPEMLSGAVGNDADESTNGELHFFNPSGTVYVKHFIATAQNSNYTESTEVSYKSGYVNSTGDIDAVQFTCSSGNFDGVIKLWGVL